MSNVWVNVSDTDTYDYVIIGGGTSGAVVARRLAEAEGNYRVCLLEAGASNIDVLDSHMPGGLGSMFKSVYDWGYETIPQKGSNARIIPVSRARLLGGCSAMNGTVLVRGAKADYDRIAAMGNPGWTWNEMMPFFKASETFHPVEWHLADLSVHGTNGPLHTQPCPLAPISEKVLQSFIDCGYDYKPDMFVQGEFEGVGHAIRTVHNGVRTTSADFVNNFNKTNLTIRTSVYVNRIILEKDNNNDDEYRAIGVEAHDEATDKLIIIKANKEIILSAGAYNSPMILMHSGIGCKEHLASVGIPCKIDLPGVGSNLLDHPTVYNSYQVSDPNLTLNKFVYDDPNNRVTSLNEWNENKTGFMSKIPFGVFALTRIDKMIEDPVWEDAKSLHGNDDPTEQLPNQPHIEFLTTEYYMDPLQFYDYGEDPQNPINDEGVFTLITLLCGPKQRGTVRLSSNDPRSEPIIDHGQLDNELDVAVLAEGCRLGHQVLMNGLGTKNLICGPWPKTRSHPNDRESWKKHVRAFTVTCSHPAGTCKMAPSTDPMGVVDHTLRVRNVKGLRIADVSILPILNSGHTQAPAFAIGEKAAHIILQSSREN